VANLLGCLNFIGKCILGVTVMIWVRWTLPRLRIDQVMKTCLKYCTPIASVMFVGAAVWTYAFPGGWLFGSSKPLGEFREQAFATSARDEAKTQPNLQTTDNGQRTTDHSLLTAYTK
jgi:hypothetical protein